jgi:hypothetical protein
VPSPARASGLPDRSLPLDDLRLPLVDECFLRQHLQTFLILLLPVVALFGVVRSSGVVGVDEKYVLVPKNDKPAGEMRRWSLRSALPELLRLPEYRDRADLPGCLREALPSDALLQGCPAAYPGQVPAGAGRL